MSLELPFRPASALPRHISLEEPLAGRLYVEPAGLVWGSAAEAAIVGGHGWPLAGGLGAFTLAVVHLRHEDCIASAAAPFAEVLSWSEGEGEEVARHVAGLLQAAGKRRLPFAGLEMDKPCLMGIVNVTPDSFSDGGRHFATEAAVAHGVCLLEAGASILDVGGESTRPGAEPVSPEEEIQRVEPVIRGLAQLGAVISVDTRHAKVMEAALQAGAKILNDVTALEGDSDSLAVAVRHQAPVILMQMRGDPRTMQATPAYDNAALDVYDYLRQRRDVCLAAGLRLEKICLDPGIGFAKTDAHNAQVLARLSLLHGLGCPLLLGVSRKSFVGRQSKGEPASQRLPGTLAAELAGLDQGVQILRVHDVAETAQALAIWGWLRQN